MSLYRETRSRRRTVVAAVAAVLLAAGFGIGFGAGRGTAPQPSLAEQAAQVREALRPALNALELVEIEYRQGSGGGSPTEAQAAAADVAAAQAAYDRVAADVRALRPAAATRTERALARLDRAVQGHEPPATVSQAVAETRTALRAVSR